MSKMAQRRRMSILDIEKMDNLLEGKDIKEISLMELFDASPSQKPKKYVKHAGDDDEEEEEEKEEEDGFEAAAKFTLDDLNDSGQPEMAKRDQMTMRLPSTSKEGDWVDAPEWAGVNFKFQVPKGALKGSKIEVAVPPPNLDEEVVKVKVPDGAAEGDVLRANASDGRRIKIAVPKGYFPGDVIRAIVPPAPPEEVLEGDDDNDIEDVDDPFSKEYSHNLTHFQNYQHLGSNAMAELMIKAGKSRLKKQERDEKRPMVAKHKVAIALQEQLVIIEDGQYPGDVCLYKPRGDVLKAFKFKVPEGASPGQVVCVQPIKQELDHPVDPVDAIKNSSSNQKSKENRRESVHVHAETFAERQLRENSQWQDEPPLRRQSTRLASVEAPVVNPPMRLHLRVKLDGEDEPAPAAPPPRRSSVASLASPSPGTPTSFATGSPRRCLASPSPGTPTSFATGSPRRFLASSVSPGTPASYGAGSPQRTDAARAWVPAPPRRTSMSTTGYDDFLGSMMSIVDPNQGGGREKPGAPIPPRRASIAEYEGGQVSGLGRYSGPGPSVTHEGPPASPPRRASMVYQ